MANLNQFALNSKINREQLADDRYGSKVLPRGLARAWEKDIEIDFDIDWKV